MNEEEAIHLAKQYLNAKGRSQIFAGSVRIGIEKIQQDVDLLRAKGDIRLAEKISQTGPYWAIHFKIPWNDNNSVIDPDVNIVTVYDNGTVEELDVL